MRTISKDVLTHPPSLGSKSSSSFAKATTSQSPNVDDEAGNTTSITVPDLPAAGTADAEPKDTAVPIEDPDAKAAPETASQGPSGPSSIQLSIEERRRRFSDHKMTPPPTHMLLYLNNQTFLRDAGQTLADEVRYARRKGLKLLMLHERDQDKGGVEFSTFFRTTPEDLTSGGIYHTLAVALETEPHRLVSFCLAAKALGAVNKALVRAPSRSEMSLNNSLKMGAVSSTKD